MIQLIRKNFYQISKLCEEHQVDSFALFVSATRSDFNNSSDIDFLVRFSNTIELLDYADNYFKFLENLAKLFNRPVDLVTEKSLKTPYSFKKSVNLKFRFMNAKALKYLLDIESILKEIDQIKLRVGNNFNTYRKDFIIKNAVEVDLEIIGEAVKKLTEQNSTLELSSAKKIIGLRNMMSHIYDSIRHYHEF
jgi:hypothetical protein